MNIKLPIRVVSILVNGVPQGWCFRDADGNVVHQDDIVTALNLRVPPRTTEEAATAADPVASMRVTLAIETLRAEGPSAEERIAAALEILETPVEEERTP